ncbi:retrovirus-related Pol polyprotein from transposon 412 [Nephila pilipes]|uniref:Retrovirus-related Pol polyprotein from transposon 412 n=1 Tax=Nephila pilipes TaxID=299642 RepID=A0A8X6QA11_NEPPI|nr:retrovirus-related Pol polyprotein from transposon 412 [Nephila pilipes]
MDMMLHSMPTIRSPKAYCEPHTTFRFNPERFQHIYVDLVGLFTLSNDFTYLLTGIDRFTRWPEAIPLSYMYAETVVKSFLANWVSRFGVPSIQTTDQGRQFQSHLFSCLKSMLRIQHIRTISISPFFKLCGRTDPLFPQTSSSMPRFLMDRIITSGLIGSANMHQG